MNDLISISFTIIIFLKENARKGHYFNNDKEDIYYYVGLTSCRNIALGHIMLGISNGILFHVWYKGSLKTLKSFF